MKKYLLYLVFLLLITAGILFYIRSGTQNFSSSIIDKNEILASDTVITENDQGYSTSEITIKKGARVVWLNETSSYIWPASNLHPTHDIYPEFDPKEPIEQGKAWFFVFKKVGEWGFHDHLKPTRRGIVRVIE